METLLKQLKELPTRLAAMPAGLRAVLIGGVGLAVVAALAVTGFARSGEYQYLFTNLTAEDSTEIAGILKNAGIPFRSEANGTALAVPADKVYDTRALLATSGLPRAGGVGLEIFGSGSDLGVSEFTQRVNLRRATEGELARTIGSFSGVRSARVTVTLGEHGLYRDEDKKPAAAVVVMLQPGRTLGERELAGIRHLVSSATPGLAADTVTVMDGRGAILSGDSHAESTFQRATERGLEQKIVEMLEPVVGVGGVVARVTAVVDTSKVTQNAGVVDPDLVAPLSERSTTTTSNNTNTTVSGVPGAQSNLPLQGQTTQPGPTQQANSTTNDATKNFDVSKTVTQTIISDPRITKISVAVMVDGVDGKPRPADEMARFAELARKAAGVDEARGDQIEITSQVFARSTDVPEVKAPVATVAAWVYAAVGAGVLLLVVLAFVLARRSAKAKVVPAQLVLSPGATVGSLEARQNAIDGVVTEIKKPATPLLIDPMAELREKARALVREDPERAVMLVRAWLSADLEKGVEHHG